MIHKRDAKDWAKAHIKGLWAGSIIPFTEDLKLNEAGIRQNVERMLQVRADGIGFGFSTPWVCSIEERKRGFEIAVEAVRGRVPIYIHPTDHSVQETINLTQHAEAVGADVVMIYPPYEWAKTQEMVCQFYEYVSSQVDIAIIVYNTYHSGICMTPETIVRLAKIPNVCAFKDAINDTSHTIQCSKLVGDQIVVSDPLEEHLLNMTLHFNQQVLLGTTPIFLMQSAHYQPIHEYYELAKQGRAAEASQKFYELQPLRDIWNSIYQVLWKKEGALHPVAHIKHWMDLIGMAGGPERPPMQSLSEEAKAEFRTKLKATKWLDRLYPERKIL